MAQQTSPKSRQEDWSIINARLRSFFKVTLRTDSDQLGVDAAFIGVPIDQGTLGRRAARFGPVAIRDAPRGYPYADSLDRGQETEGFYNIDAGGELLRGVTMADYGDNNILPQDLHRTFDKLTQAVEKRWRRDAFPGIVGGEHAITWPALRKLSRFNRLSSRPFQRPYALHSRLSRRAPRAPSSYTTVTRFHS